MTCIVGISTKDKVYIGGDRSISDSEVVLSISRPKVYKINGWVFGYAGALGTGQLLEFFNFPKEVNDPYKTLRLDIIEEYRKAIAAFGKDDEESTAEILIGYQNRLFELNTFDWSVIEMSESSVGSGCYYALGSLYTTSSIYTDSITRINMAIESAIHCSPTCKGPIDIVYT